MFTAASLRTDILHLAAALRSSGEHQIFLAHCRDLVTVFTFDPKNQHFAQSHRCKTDFYPRHITICLR